MPTHLYWQRAAGSGNFARLRTSTMAIVARSESTGMNSGELLIYPAQPKLDDYAFMSVGTRVCVLPSLRPMGMICVTLIADYNICLVPESSLLYVGGS